MKKVILLSAGLLFFLQNVSAMLPRTSITKGALQKMKYSGKAADYAKLKQIRVDKNLKMGWSYIIGMENWAEMEKKNILRGMPWYQRIFGYNSTAFKNLWAAKQMEYDAIESRFVDKILTEKDRELQEKDAEIEALKKKEIELIREKLFKANVSTNYE